VDKSLIMATFGSATLPPHHSHFQHHVRTKGWGIEPGWKLVSKNVEEKRSFTLQPTTQELLLSRKLSKMIDNSNNMNARRVNGGGITGLRERNANSSVSDRDRFTHFENGIGRMKPPPPSQPPKSTMPSTLSSSSSTTSSASAAAAPTWRIGASKEDICPIHHVPAASSSSSYSSSLGSAPSANSNVHWFASVGRAAGSRPYSNQRPSILPGMTTSSTTTAAPSTARAQSPIDPRRYSPPPSSVASSASASSSNGSGSSSEVMMMPPGVLKKPGSGNRSGPKHMKKVAFLENAEFSRGIP